MFQYLAKAEKHNIKLLKTLKMILELLLGIPWQSSGWDLVFSAEGPGLILGQGNNIPQTFQRSQKKKKQTSLFHIKRKEILINNLQGKFLPCNITIDIITLYK